MAILWVTKRGVEDFQKHIQKLLSCHPLPMFFCNHPFGRVSWRICFGNISWPKWWGIISPVFFRLVFHVYLAALILSISDAFGYFKKHGSMTPNTVVFPCVSVHVKIMSLLLLLGSWWQLRIKVFIYYNHYIEEFPSCIDSPTSHQSFVLKVDLQILHPSLHATHLQSSRQVFDSKQTYIPD